MICRLPLASLLTLISASRVKNDTVKEFCDEAAFWNHASDTLLLNMETEDFEDDTTDKVISWTSTSFGTHAKYPLHPVRPTPDP
mmetsp:Transcript_8662/g.16655  ORF Transcript_8662/g.16655 Transcript_8662/m.16655 type:complete len:84 (+) Transcript_8662:329-580(+)